MQNVFKLSFAIIAMLGYFAFPPGIADVKSANPETDWIEVPYFEVESFIRLLDIRRERVAADYVDWCYREQLKCDNPRQISLWSREYYRYVCGLLDIPPVRATP